MALIDDIRKKYAGSAYDKMSDFDIAKHIADSSGRKVDAVAYDLGIDLSLPKSDIGKEIHAGGNNYAAGMRHIQHALTGNSEYLVKALNDSDRAEFLQSQSNAPHSWDEVKIGDSDKGLTSYLGQGFASSLPYMAEAAGYGLADYFTGGMLTPGIVERYAGQAALKAGASESVAKNIGNSAAKTAGMTAATYPSALGDVLSNQYQQSGEYNMGYALPAALPYAALNSLGLEGALARRSITRGLVEPTTSRLANTAIGFGRTGIEEAIGETGQEVVNQFGRRSVDSSYDPMGAQAMAAYKESAILGGLMGGLPGGIHGAFQKGTIDHSDPTDLLGKRTTHEDQAYYQALQGANNFVTPDYVTPNVNQGAGVGTQEWVNQQTGVGASANVSRKDVGAAFNEKLDTPQIVLDANGTPYTTDSAADVFEFEQFGRTSKNATKAQKAAAQAQQNTQNTAQNNTQDNTQAAAMMEAAWDYVYPETGEAIPRAAELGIKSIKKQQAYEMVASALDDGTIDQAEFEAQVNAIQTTQKIGSLTTRIEKELRAAREVKATGSNVSTADSQALGTVLKSMVTPEQLKWWEARQDPLNENKSDATIAKELGFTRQNGSKLAKNSRKVVAQKVANAFGITPEEADARIVEHLKATAPRAVAAENNVGMSPESQQSVVDKTDLTSNDESGSVQSMGTINSIGGSQRGNMSVGKTELPPNYVESVKPSNNAKAGAAVARQQHIQAMLNDPEHKNAANDWNDFKSEGTPEFHELSPEVRADFISDYIEIINAKEEYDWSDGEELRQIELAQREAEQTLGSSDVRDSQSTGKVEGNSTGSTQTDGRKKSEVRAIGKNGSTDGSTNTATTDDELARLIASQEEDVQSENVDDSETEDGGARRSESGATAGTSVVNIKATLKALFLSPAKFDQLVKIVQSVKDIPENVRANAQLSDSDRTTQGFAWEGKVYLIADNIAEKSTLAVFLHELGVHVGLEKLLGEDNFRNLAAQISEWSARTDNSIEARLARKAMERVESAANSADRRGQTFEDGDYLHEMIAYFVEEAVLAGVDPTAVTHIKSVGLRNWFRKFTAAMKLGLRKLSLGRFDLLTAQNIVDMTFGAADLELNGTWHGTAADFRNFDHKYMGSGEGAQAFGWGSYFAQRKGIANDYLEQDVRRKSSRATHWVNEKRDAINKFANVIKDKYSEKIAEILSKEGAQSGHLKLAKILGFIDMQRFNMNSYSEFLQAIGQEIANENFTRIMGGRMNSPFIGDENSRVVKVTPAMVNEAIDKLLKSKPIEGSMMRVRPLVADNELLDWDAPLDEQSPQVQKVLDKISDDIKERADDLSRHGNATGETLYRAIHEAADEGMFWKEAGVEDTGRRQDAQKVASLYLDKLGIPGLKFLDQPSRNLNTDTRRAEKHIADMEETLAGFKYKYKNGDKPTKLDELQIKALEVNIAQAKKDLDAAQSATRNIVVFNDKNISRAATQVGGDSNRVRFSQTDEEVPEEQSTVRYPLNAKRKAVMTDVGAAFAKVTPKLLTNYQLVDQFGKKLKALVEYMNLNDKMTVLQQKLVRSSHDILESWNKLSRTSPKMAWRLSGVMHDATLEGIHPDLAFDDELNSHLDKTKDREKYDALKLRYNALTTEAKETYQAVKATLENNWKLRKEIYADVVRMAYAKQLELAKASKDQKEIDRIEAKIAKEIENHADQIKSIRGPYFPLMRFGDFLVIAESNELQAAREELQTATGDRFKEVKKRVVAMEKDAKHYQVHSFDKASEQKAMAAKLENTHEVRLTKGEDYQRELRPSTFGQLEQLDNVLGTEFGSRASGISAKIRDAVTEMYLSSMPEHSALQRQIKRHGIQGASQDMMRSFAELMERDSFYLSRMRFMPEITSSLYKMKDESRASNELRDVYNNVKARMAMDFSYTRAPVAAFVSKLSSIWHLGISPSYLLINGTQPWTITMPQLAGKFGGAKAFGAMRSAWADSVRIIKGGRNGEFFSLSNADLSKTLAGDELRMATELQDLGKLDIAQNIDTEVYASGTDPKWIRAQRVFNWASHNIELTNRLSTALATYRLERSRGATHEDATSKAREGIELTQLTYDDTNAAYFMKSGHLGGWNRMPMQFRKYQQGMIYLLVRNAKEAFKGDKEAQRSLGYLLMMQLATAGAAGLPLAFPLAVVGSLFGDDDDEKGDYATQVRNYLADMLGPDAARVFWKGLPTLIGLDISRNIGMGDLFNPLPMMRWSDVTNAKTGKDAVATLLFNAAGAPFGTMADMFEGIQMASHGEIERAVEKMLPKFLASPVKAVRYATDGLTTRSGNVAVESDRFDGWDLAYKALGFSPVVESEHYAAQNSKEDVAQAINARRKEIYSQYAQARLSGENASEVREAVAKFNSDHPKQRITQEQLLQSLQQRRSSKKEYDEAGVRYSKRDKSLKGVDRYAY
jgi:hypothetical protein